MIIHTSEIAISKLPQVQLDSSFPLPDVVHMILAGGPAQTLYNLSTGSHQRALEYICRDAEGAIIEDKKGLPRFSFDRPRRVHESLGVLAVAGTHFARIPIRTSEGNEGTLQDLADAAMHEAELREHVEHSWQLMLFSIHPGVTSEWQNHRGDTLSVERILLWEMAKPYGGGSCFGTHRLEGISFALRRFCLEADVEPSQLAGTWRDAFEYLQGAIRLIQRNQRDDGSLQRSWFRKKSIPTLPLEWREMIRDLASYRSSDASLVYSTGHCLDSLSSMAEFLPEEREWMQRACYILAQTIESRWTQIGRNIGPLTHAIHALKLLDV